MAYLLTVSWERSTRQLSPASTFPGATANPCTPAPLHPYFFFFPDTPTVRSSNGGSHRPLQQRACARLGALTREALVFVVCHSCAA